MARNRGGRSIAGTVFLWFVAVLMIVSAAVGIKWVKETEFNFNGTSNAETPTSIVPVSIPSDEDVSSIEDSSGEPISSEVIEPNPIDELPEVESRGKFITYSEENIAPLIQTAYRSSATHALLTLLDNNNESTNFSFNSLKMTKVPDTTELRIQFGFPSTLNETHYDQFGLGGTYSSYLIGEYKMLNDEGLYINFNDDLLIDSEGYKAYFYFIYRNNENLEWQNVQATAEQLFIEADNLYYQFGLVFNVNSKSTKALISGFKLGAENLFEYVISFSDYTYDNLFNEYPDFQAYYPYYDDWNDCDFWLNIGDQDHKINSFPILNDVPDYLSIYIFERLFINDLNELINLENILNKYTIQIYFPNHSDIELDYDFDGIEYSSPTSSNSYKRVGAHIYDLEAFNLQKIKIVLTEKPTA